MTGYNVFILAILILGGVELVTAQIPSVCANNANLTSGVCCPDNCGGSARGECVHVSKMCKTDYDTAVPRPPNDERFNWPSKIFNYTCQCKGNYGDYDCSDCKFGYEGHDCSTKTTRIRKSITAEDFDWANYRMQLNRSKTEIQSRYKVYTGGNLTDESNYKEVSLFNLFAWMHHYIAWTSMEDYEMSGTAGDYAHESVGFLTWHRIYLLWFEREMQKFLPDNEFTVRYWDWTKPENRLTLFADDRLGSYDPASGEVTGQLMNDWYIVCAKSNGKSDKSKVCDPTTQENKHVFRCGSVGRCEYPDWPDAENVIRGVNDFDNYRTITNTNPEIVNKYDLMSFSNYMEGFARDDECEASLTGEKRIVLCGENPEIRRRLHNLIHVLVGIYGTIGDIPIAANDPVFINHHTMIDCLFEQWLTKHPNRENMYPESLDARFAGHAAGDCVVPFIPLYNHSEVFLKSADDYGYRCNLSKFESPPHTGTSNPTNPPATNPPTTNPPGQPSNPGNQPGTPKDGAESLFASATMLVSMIVVYLVAIAL